MPADSTDIGDNIIEIGDNSGRIGDSIVRIGDNIGRIVANPDDIAGKTGIFLCFSVKFRSEMTI